MNKLLSRSAHLEVEESLHVLDLLLKGICHPLSSLETGREAIEAPEVLLLIEREQQLNGSHHNMTK